MSKISVKIYGTADRRIVQALFEANRDKLKSKHLVKVDQRLRIPPWPATSVKRTPRLIPLSQRAVPPAGVGGTIRLPVPQRDRRLSDQRIARSVTPGKSGSVPSANRKTGKGSTKQTASNRKRYRWHRIRRNESLSTIARDKLGNGRRWPEIYKLNRKRIRRPNRLPVGKLIKVPLAVPA